MQPSETPELKKSSLLPLIGAVVGFVVLTVTLIIAIQVIGAERIRALIEEAGVFAPLAYILVKALTFVFAPLSSGPIQFSAGIMFGLIPGTIYTVIGEVIGGSISFFIARRFGREVVRRFVREEGLRRADEFAGQIVDWKTLSYARLFLFSIYDFISYAVGMTRLPFRTYLIVSATVGIIPTLVAVALGSSMTETRVEVVALYVGIAVVSALPLIFQKQLRRWLKIGVNETAKSP